MTAPKPMTPETFRRLMASAETREAERWQGLQEAYGMGALTGLLMLRALGAHKGKAADR